MPESFFDTNVLLYLLSGNEAKADQAEALVARGGVVSVQVLNEFASVGVRKLGMTYPEVRDALGPIRAICEVVPVTVETHELGLEMAERYGFPVYDALIAAAALRAGCTTLYSEDFQDGQRVGRRLVVRNPFGMGEGRG